MSDSRLKQYLEQRTHMVKHYFWTNSFKIALRYIQKKFKEMPDLKTMQQVVEQFQTAYILEDEPRSGRPCDLSKADQTKLKEHMDENLGTSAQCSAQELGHKRETVRTTIKEVGYFLYVSNFSFTRIEARRLCSTIRLLLLVFREIWSRCWNNDNNILHRRSMVSPFRLRHFKKLSNMVKQ